VRAYELRKSGQTEEPLAVNTRIVVVEQLSSRTLLVTTC
jgi:hypothetical protein